MSEYEQESENSLGDRLEEAASGPVVSVMARAGWIMKGIVFGLIGLLALGLAVGLGGETAGAGEALDEISGVWTGRVLLGLIALGLAGYAVWRFAQAILDIDDEGHHASALATRVSYFSRGATYAFLAFVAARMVLNGGGSGDEGGGQEDMVAMAFDLLPLGRWIVGAVGLGVLASGVYQFVAAYTLSFKEPLDKDSMNSFELALTRWLGRYGFVARGVTFCVIGMLTMRAALDFAPQEAGGIGEAFEEILFQPFGGIFLGAVALGFISYGFYCAMFARYRVIG
jgi:hypothetical protein